MELTLNEIATRVNGVVVGDDKCNIVGVSEIQNSEPGTITFLGNSIYSKFVSSTKAEAVIVSSADYLKGKNGIIVDNPQLAIAKVLALFHQKILEKPSIDPTAIIEQDVTLGSNIMIGPGSVIQKGAKIKDGCRIGPKTVIGQNTKLGKDCVLHSNVSLYNDIMIGDRVIIHSGTVIGCDGYGYVTVDSKHEKIPQTGNVVINNDVEIGSNCAIDRATIGSTVIGEMTKIDNLVHIAHNVKIGRGCLLTAGFAVAGSAEIGDYCTFAGQAGIAPHVKIGDNSIIAAKSGVTKSLKGNEVYAGMPAREIKTHNKKMAYINKIERLYERVDRLAQKINIE